MELIAEPRRPKLPVPEPAHCDKRHELFQLCPATRATIVMTGLAKVVGVEIDAGGLEEIDRLF